VAQALGAGTSAAVFSWLVPERTTPGARIG
jgi:hypothetical protein